MYVRVLQYLIGQSSPAWLLYCFQQHKAQKIGDSFSEKMEYFYQSLFPKPTRTFVSSGTVIPTESARQVADLPTIWGLTFPGTGEINFSILAFSSAFNR